VFSRNLQAFAPPDALHAIFADPPAGVLEQRRDSSITEAAILAGEGEDRLRKPILVVRLCRLIALRGAPLPDQPAGAPFGESFVPCVLNGEASPRGT
jgi:hypothetical protein